MTTKAEIFGVAPAVHSFIDSNKRYYSKYQRFTSRMFTNKINTKVIIFQTMSKIEKITIGMYYDGCMIEIPRNLFKQLSKMNEMEDEGR